jgi:hypothetical protein
MVWLRPLRLMHSLAAPMPKVEEGKGRICEFRGL